MNADRTHSLDATAEPAAPTAEPTPATDRGPTAPAPAVRPLVWWWLISRAATVLLLVAEHFEVFGDVEYYHRSMVAIAGPGGIADTLREYPVPSIAVFTVPWLVTGAHLTAYAWTFLGFMLLIDAAFVTALWRRGGRRIGAGLRLWLWFVPALGPITLCRLDLVPAVLGAAALLVVARRASASALLAAAGAAVKLWPLALVPSLWLSRRRAGGGQWRLVAVFTVALASVFAVVLAWVGPARTLSPLTWQSDRSLQLESYAALPLLVAGVLRPGTWHSEYTRFFAFEVIGPGVPAMLAVSTVLTVLAVLLLAWLWLRAVRSATIAEDAPGLLALGTVGLMIITDKTFSPQYLIWLGALAAAHATVTSDAGTVTRHRLLLAIAVLTQVVYPNLYSWLTALQPAAVLLVATRDLAFVAWTAMVLYQFHQSTGRAVERRP